MKFIVNLTRNDSQKRHILALCPSSVQKKTEKSIVRVDLQWMRAMKKDYTFQVSTTTILAATILLFSTTTTATTILLFSLLLRLLRLLLLLLLHNSIVLPPPPICQFKGNFCGTVLKKILYPLFQPRFELKLH